MNARHACRVLALTLAALLLAAMPARAQQREMGVRQPPESVFGQPAENVMPRLTGASPTGENGRVGGELVFWGYRLADGSPVYFFACAMLAHVNCDERIAAICPTRTTTLERSEHTGDAVRRRCREVAIAMPGEVRPGCTSMIFETPLAIGLVTCG